MSAVPAEAHEVASLPNPTAMAGELIYVADAPEGDRWAVSDGVKWSYVVPGARNWFGQDPPYPTETLLALWDGDALEGAAGSAVASWPATDGAVATPLYQSTSGNRPVIREGIFPGKSVEFEDANSQWLQSNNVNLNGMTHFDVFVSLRRGAGDTGDSNYFGIYGGDEWLRMIQVTDFDRQLFLHSNGSQVFPNGNEGYGIPLGSKAISGIHMAPATLGGRKNAAVKTEAVAIPAWSGNGYFVFGRRDTHQNDYVDADVRRIMVYGGTRALTAGEIADVLTYLNEGIY